MIPYSQYRPTGADPCGLALHDRQDWLVGPVSINRDSGVLSKANWESFLEGCPEGDDVEVHRFGHWACGWFEIALIRPGSEAERIAEELEAFLSDYPVLDDGKYSALQEEAITGYWTQQSIKWRIRDCVRAKVSIFQARKEVPGRELREMLEYELGV